MIELYTTGTPNGQRPLIMLEECGLAYAKHYLDREKREQHDPAFTRLNRLAALPVLVDPDADGGPLTLTQSSAILLYLAEKTGQLLPRDARGRGRVFEAQMLAQTDAHAALGQLVNANRRMPAGPGRDWQVQYHEARLAKFLGECERRVAENNGWLAGSYSIADVVLFPSLNDPLFAGDVTDTMPALRDWRARIAARPAVPRALAACRP